MSGSAPDPPSPRMKSALSVAVVGLVLLALPGGQQSFPWPGTVFAQAEDPQIVLARAGRLRRDAEPEAAQSLLTPLAQHRDPNVAASAGLGLAVLKLEAGAPGEAAAMLDAILAKYPETTSRDRAVLLSGISKRLAGDCQASLAALADQRLAGGRLKFYAAYQSALCAQRLGDGPRALALAQAAREGGPRLLRIEALELRASVQANLGQQVEALATWLELNSMAMTAGYKAETRLNAAQIARALGRTEDASRLFADVVVDYPATSHAVEALEALVQLDALDLITSYQAGLVRYFSRNYPLAQRNFEACLLSPEEAANHPAARYFRAISLLRQSFEQEAIEALLGLPGLHPVSDFAPEALMRAGRLLESQARMLEASEAYSRLARDYPSSGLAEAARFRLALASIVQNRPKEASDYFAALSGADIRSDALLWLGKLASRDDPAKAASYWREAINLAPYSFAGLRSAALLKGEQQVRPTNAPVDSGRLGMTSGDLSELESWFAGRGARWPTLAAELASEAELARADDLLSIGQETLASWEIDELGTRLAADPARTTSLAVALAERGVARDAMRQAGAALRSSGLKLIDAPTALRKALYPLPYSSHFIKHGPALGADPLLLAAVVRQESSFNPQARSAAGALGLTQVMPGTGEMIAHALGRQGFQEQELYQPAVSILFGAYFLGQTLQGRGGNLFPALADYNAGRTAVDSWLKDLGSDDPDMFAERIPFAETYRYVQTVYENYGVYRGLYGLQP